MALLLLLEHPNTSLMRGMIASYTPLHLCCHLRIRLPSADQDIGGFCCMFRTPINNDNQLSKHSQDKFLRVPSRSLRPIQDIEQNKYHEKELDVRANLYSDLPIVSVL